MKARILLTILLLVCFSCTSMKHRKVYMEGSSAVDNETQQKIESILDKIDRIAKRSTLEYLGKSTMKESVDIMDSGPMISYILIEYLKTSENWKFRYWLVDMLGYLRTRHNIIPLIEVIEDATENVSVRIKACESVLELSYITSVEQLAISKDIVKNHRVRAKIDEVIKSLE